MSVIESIIYGLISGIAEFFPVSSQAHQILLRYMFGAESRNFLQEFLVHIGVLLAILLAYRDLLSQMRREQKNLQYRKKRKSDSVLYYDIRLLKTTTIPLLILICLFSVLLKRQNGLLSTAAFLVVNAIILLLAAHSQHGNRDARTMSGLDGIVFGILGSLSVFPGISRIGIVSCYSTLRGADSKNTMNWAILLSIPAIVLYCVFDLVGVFRVGIDIVSFTALVGYVLSGIAAFCGGYFSISVLLTLLNHIGFSHFAYYSFGVSLFSFILYLIT